MSSLAWFNRERCARTLCFGGFFYMLSFVKTWYSFLGLYFKLQIDDFCQKTDEAHDFSSSFCLSWPMKVKTYNHPLSKLVIGLKIGLDLKIISHQNCLSAVKCHQHHCILEDCPASKVDDHVHCDEERENKIKFFNTWWGPSSDNFVSVTFSLVSCYSWMV